MVLRENDRIVGAWAEAPAGPGWANELVWVCIRDGWTGQHRVEALQPDEQSREIRAIFPFALVATGRLMHEVVNSLSK